MPAQRSKRAIDLLGQNVPREDLSELSDKPLVEEPKPTLLVPLPPGVPAKLVKALQELDSLFRQLTWQKEEAVAEQDFERAARLRDQAAQLERAVVAIVSELQNKLPGGQSEK